MSETAAGTAEIPDSLWDEFAPSIKAGIEREYDQLDRKEGEGKNQNKDWMRAFLQYTSAIERAQDRRMSWWRANVTGLMFISAVMALSFGFLGAWGLQAGGVSKDVTSGFLDIAKLFAGTLVGAAGATGLSRR